MFTSYPLFQSHLDVAHHYWKKLVQPGDTVIDATCGNGHDTLVLAKLVLNSPSGKVIGMDVQSQAIKNTQERLAKEFSANQMQRIHLHCACHSTFPVQAPHVVKLIVYNLGYLPNGDKSLTTCVNTTLLSLQAALSIITPGGAISLTCYPGHAEGKREEQAILSFVRGLQPQEWSCSYQTWINRHQAPGLLFIQKANLTPKRA
ncbi:class I SAM-dependent methyltransferase [Parachlamydia sp. AcF125]|uniref:class I SAM-dependent methyltransferase n=1 Tax=Parachlamydia sp. AcF125 TaxID=2795736 RepID=UPI001BC91B08|nr:class I SAM-dependent methyltransferase [Parachlamydia sp. AcF125]MBS4168805.1 2-phytyl-1,4-naphtoquinone methyltransferase [Parachlamydia sp. AcF125]